MEKVVFENPNLQIAQFQQVTEELKDKAAEMPCSNAAKARSCKKSQAEAKKASLPLQIQAMLSSVNLQDLKKAGVTSSLLEEAADLLEKQGSDEKKAQAAVLCALAALMNPKKGPIERIDVEPLNIDLFALICQMSKRVIDTNSKQMMNQETMVTVQSALSSQNTSSILDKSDSTKNYKQHEEKKHSSDWWVSLIVGVVLAVVVAFMPAITTAVLGAVNSALVGSEAVEATSMLGKLVQGISKMGAVGSVITGATVGTMSGMSIYSVSQSGYKTDTSDADQDFQTSMTILNNAAQTLQNSENLTTSRITNSDQSNQTGNSIFSSEIDMMAQIMRFQTA